MNFTRQELDRELRQFLIQYAYAVERFYGLARAGELLGCPGRSAHDIGVDEATFSDRLGLHANVLEMYDYGICGHAHPWFGEGRSAANDYGNADMFLRHLEPQERFLDDIGVPLPRRAIRTVRTAIARHVLDGGTRDDASSEELDGEEEGYLTFAELALLAAMDERSVRNAANPKLADPLRTEPRGKRTLIGIEEARRWLNCRKGFVPTRPRLDEAASPPPTRWLAVDVPPEVYLTLVQEARRLGISPGQVVGSLLPRHPDQA